MLISGPTLLSGSTSFLGPGWGPRPGGTRGPGRDPGLGTRAGGDPGQWDQGRGRTWAGGDPGQWDQGRVGHGPVGPGPVGPQGGLHRFPFHT